MTVPVDDEGPDYSFPDHTTHMETFGDDTTGTLRVICTCGWNKQVTDLQATNGAWRVFTEQHRNENGIYR
jgi:hypothetical protein